MLHPPPVLALQEEQLSDMGAALLLPPPVLNRDNICLILDELQSGQVAFAFSALEIIRSNFSPQS